VTLAPQFVWKCVNCSMRVATHGDLHVNERPLCVQCNAEMEPYQPGDDSEPSLSGRINALPDWARQHIHDIETRCDPAGDVRTIGELRDTIRALEKCGVSLEVYQHDWTPGFAAFMDDGRIAQGAPAHVSLNLGSLLCAVETADLPAADLPYIVAESLMHEAIHALESWSNVEFSEDRVEGLLASYREKYGRKTVWEYTGQPPHDVGVSEHDRAQFKQLYEIVHAAALMENISAGDREALLWAQRKLDKFYRLAEQIGNLVGGPTTTYAPTAEVGEWRERAQEISGMVQEALK